MRTLCAGQIEYLVSTDTTRVDAGRKVLSTSVGDVPYTGINIVLPMRTPALLRQAGLGERWANVKLPSFQSAADPLVYVIDDAQGSHLPKSGHVAFGAGQPVSACRPACNWASLQVGQPASGPACKWASRPKCLSRSILSTTPPPAKARAIGVR